MAVICIWLSVANSTFVEATWLVTCSTVFRFALLRSLKSRNKTRLCGSQFLYSKLIYMFWHMCILVKSRCQTLWPPGKFSLFFDSSSFPLYPVIKFILFVFYKPISLPIQTWTWEVGLIQWYGHFHVSGSSLLTVCYVVEASWASFNHNNV